jgi:REP element-mobilizing transposase RayT
MPHTSTNLLIHLIFSTKQRCASIRPAIKDDLFAYMGGIIREMHGVALIVNGTADHVHVLMRNSPIHSIAEVARVLKTLFSLDPRKMGESSRLCVADRLWGIQCQRIECARGDEVHRGAGKTSPEEIISRGVP